MSSPAEVRRHLTLEIVSRIDRGVRLRFDPSGWTRSAGTAWRSSRSPSR